MSTSTACPDQLRNAGRSTHGRLQTQLLRPQGTGTEAKGSCLWPSSLGWRGAAPEIVMQGAGGGGKGGIPMCPTPGQHVCQQLTLSEGVSLVAAPLRVSRWHVRTVEFYSHFSSSGMSLRTGDMAAVHLILRF